MTDAELHERLLDLVVNDRDNVVTVLLEECKRLSKTGAVDLLAYDNDLRLPRILMSAALKTMAWNYGSVFGTDKKVVDNLEHF